MIFGDKTALAIEAEFVVAQGRWRYGKLRFWIGGREFGDFDDTSDLAGSAFSGRTFLAKILQRTHAELDATPAPDAYRQLYGRFMERTGATAREPLISGPFLLDEVGEASLRDRVSVLAVRRADGWDRLIVKNHADGSVFEHRVPPGVVDEVIASYCAWAESL